jgi:predicted ribosome quality control (RQC) complex YloA/Tae2 family protein
MEEKREMASLDLRFLARELKIELSGGFFRKIYQNKIEYGKGRHTHQFIFVIFSPGKGERRLYVDRNKMFITNYKRPSSEDPLSFCMLLRSRLSNKRLLDISQHGFERIMEIKTDDNVLVIELFSDGNVILCDSQRNIIAPLYSQRWKDREVRPKVRYEYPPERANPYETEHEKIIGMFHDSRNNVISVLASGLGLGPEYAKEVCIRSKIDGQMPGKKLEKKDFRILYDTILSMDAQDRKPVVYENTVAPFPMESMEGERIKKQTQSFSESLDEFFTGRQIRSKQDSGGKKTDKKKEKISRIIDSQKAALEKLARKREEKKETADMIYNHYSAVSNILEGIMKAKESGMRWPEIKEKIRASKTEDARMIKEIKEDECAVIIALEGKDVKLDFRKSVEENAASYYEDSKHAKRKMLGAEKALTETREKFEFIPLEDEEKEDMIPVKIEKKKTRWFEAFRWFTTSDGFLVVAGKDAGSNEVLIKKHTEPKDIVFHSEIRGAPFTVIKTEGKEPSYTAKREAAQFAGAYSKAWQLGHFAVDVYAINPDQVSKKPQSGEYLQKGSFMIYGQREWFRKTELRLSIGFVMDKEKGTGVVVSGSTPSVKKLSSCHLSIKPGNKPAGDLAREIKSVLLSKAKEEDREWMARVPVDDISRIIPAGKGEVERQV